MNTLVQEGHVHVNDLKVGGPNIVAVTVPGKLDTTTVNLPTEQARLHNLALSRVLQARSIGDVTSFSEVVGNIRDGYSQRTLAVLSENSGRMTFIHSSGDEVGGVPEGEPESDLIRLHPETLVGNILLAREALDLFRTRK